MHIHIPPLPITYAAVNFCSSACFAQPREMNSDYLIQQEIPVTYSLAVS